MAKHGSKEELIKILEFVKDKVIVTGSYAEGTQTEKSDIDFFVKLKPDNEVDFEAAIVEDTYTQEIIRYFENNSISWGSIFVDSIHTDFTYIPLEFSAYYQIDEKSLFEINILGVKLMASKSIYSKE